MPSMKHNSITAKAMGLIFLLFDVGEVPFGIAVYQYIDAFFWDLSSFVFHSSLLTVKSVNLVVAHDGLILSITRNHSYFS